MTDKIRLSVASGEAAFRVWLKVSYGDRFRGSYGDELYCFKWYAKDKQFDGCERGKADQPPRKRRARVLSILLP